MSKKIAILLLICLVIFQSYLIYKKTYSGYMFDTKYNQERINVDYLLLSSSLELIKDKISLNKETNITILIDNKEGKYNIPLQYYYDKQALYPANLIIKHKLKALSEYTNEIIINDIKLEKIDYIIIVGKNHLILNQTTVNDISIYKTNGESLELVNGYDMNIYSFYKECIKLNKEEHFNNMLDKIINYIKNYKNYYGTTALDSIYKYADDLYINGDYDKALTYYNLYLETNALDKIIHLNKGKIYFNQKKYDKALEEFNYCKAIEGCNIDDANRYIEQMKIGEEI